MDQTAGAGDQQTSEVIVVGATVGSGTDTIIGPSGTQVVFFEDLEPINTNVPAATLTVNGAAIASLLNGANQITYDQSDVFGATWGRVTVDAFEPIHFTNKTNLVVDGENGDDTMVANNANLPTGLQTITLQGDLGDDTIRFEALPNAAATAFVSATGSGGAGDDEIDGSLIAVNTTLTLNGNAGNDTLTGGAGVDALNGGADNDMLVDSPAADTFDGGAGNDTLAYFGTIANDTIDVFQNSPIAVVGGAYTLNSPTGVNFIASTNVALTPSNAANRPSIERILINMREGDDAIRVGHAHNYGDGDNTNGIAAQAIRFQVEGDAPNASDLLVVRDDVAGDTIIHRVGADQRSGSVTVGSLPPTDYTGVESTQVQPVNQITGGTGQDAMGRLVVFKNDPFEPNNTLPNATFLGAGPTINSDPTIDPAGGPFGIPGDADFYQFVAQETGTLDFQLYFEPIGNPVAGPNFGNLANGQPGLPGLGELNATFFDNNGVPVAGIGGSGALNILDAAGAKIGERITVPVVRNQTYFVRIQGDTAPVVNVYNFTAVTVAAPIPELVDLQAASDSGRNNTDDITNIATPTFNIILDDDRIDAFANINLLPDNNNDNLQTVGFDYGVQVFNNGNPIGFAFHNPVLGANTWTFTTPAASLNQGDSTTLAPQFGFATGPTLAWSALTKGRTPCRSPWTLSPRR